MQFVGTLRRCHSRLTSPLTPEQLGWYGFLVRQPGRPGGCLGGGRCSREGLGLENLWRQYFQDHGSGDRTKQSREVVRLNNVYKAGWMDVQLAALGRSLPQGPGPGRPADHDSGVMALTVSKLCREGHLAEAVEALELLVQTDCCIPKSLVYRVLSRCVAKKDLVLGRRVHSVAVVSGYQSDTFLGFHILRMYASHGRLQDSMDVFEEVAKPDAFAWSAIISAHVKYGHDRRAIELYHLMRRSSVKPDGHVFMAALQACGREADLETGQQVHADALASGVVPDMLLCNSLVTMYIKCGSLEDARNVFAGLRHKNVVTWTAMIAGYCRQGLGQEALLLYSAMEAEGMTVPNSVTFVCLLQACARVGAPALEKGKHFHGLIREQGYQADLFVANSLVSMYAKCGSLQDARKVFDGLVKKNVVTWNSMIAGYSQQAMGQEALRLYRAMQEEGTPAPDAVTFVSLLQACAGVSRLALCDGKQIHAQIRAHGFEADVLVTNSLVNMYAKCGSLEDAQRVFDGLARKDVVTWNCMIAGYSQQGMGQEALELYSAMLEEGIAVPNVVTFASLLQGCASVGNPALEKGKRLHTDIQERGFHVDVFVANSLVNMYGKCGSLADAQRVFEGLSKKDEVTWTAMIAGYSRQGMGVEALQLYIAMQEEGLVVPNSVTFVCILQACASVGTPALEKGKQLHMQIRELGHDADVFVASSLVNMYAKCGSLEDSQRVFHGCRKKNEVMWTAIISGYSQRGMGQEALHLYSAMQEEGIAVRNRVTFVCLLQACASEGSRALEKGKQLHMQIRDQGLEAGVFVASSLVNMYAKCGSLEDAQNVFDGVGEKNVVVWNAMIAGYSQQGMGHQALRLYSAMQDEGVCVPDSVTYVCLLQACASVGAPALEMGKEFHKLIAERGDQVDVFLASSLVNMYVKCGCLEEAERLFCGLGEKDVVTWNALIAGYLQLGMGQEALRLYGRMDEAGDPVTFICLLQACAIVGSPALGMGKQLHAQIAERGQQADVFVASSLVNMYAKCGSLEAAETVFEGLSRKDVVMWTSMLAGYSQQGMGQEALHLYRAMQEEGLSAPNKVTLVCLLQACASTAALYLGRQLHAHILEQGLQSDGLVASSLIHMYGKSGSMGDAQQVFDALPERNVVSWSALIAGYACQGDSEAVFDLVQRMRDDGVWPDGITSLSVLTACCHAGLVEKTQEFFQAMSRDYGVRPSQAHYTCMVDALGRAGHLNEALALVRTMPVLPNGAVWHTLLGACQKWSNVEVGQHAFKEAVKLDQKDAAAYVLMSNIYTGAQMWEQAQKVQAKRKRLRAWKQPGESWWTDMDGVVHRFPLGMRVKQSRVWHGRAGMC